jgi:hypothetical protein
MSGGLGLCRVGRICAPNSDFGGEGLFEQTKPILNKAFGINDMAPKWLRQMGGAVFLGLSKSFCGVGV